MILGMDENFYPFTYIADSRGYFCHNFWAWMKIFIPSLYNPPAEGVFGNVLGY